MKQYSDLYKNELLENVVPFWLKHSPDKKYGGYYTCLNRDGSVYDTDKFMWLQGRQVWMFSMLFNEVERKQEWLDMAVHGAEFMRKYGRDKSGDWYFSLTEKGEPLVQPYNIFSDCFAAMGFGKLALASQNEDYANIARESFNNIISRQNNPKGIYNKQVSGTRPMKNFALPMILCNLSLELEPIVGSGVVNKLIPDVLHEVMEVFYKKEKGVILENVSPDGSFVNSFEGRLVNPGHAIEAMWFIMDLAERLNDKELINKAGKIAIDMLNYGWDEKYGGIFYFMDLNNAPLQQLEWDQKLWWVHLESLICMAKAYRLTGEEKYKNWFEKLHDYTWNHFRDNEYPEWFGYLNRRGEVLLPLKGGKWKGCYHVPRALYQVWKTLEQPVQSVNPTNIIS